MQFNTINSIFPELKNFSYGNIKVLLHTWYVHVLSKITTSLSMQLSIYDSNNACFKWVQKSVTLL